MGFNRQTLLILCALVILAVFYSFPPTTEDSTQNQSDNASSVESPSSFVKQSLITSYDINGEINLRVNVSEALMYDSSEKISLKQPRIEFNQLQSDTFRTFVLKADSGTYQSKEQVLELEGNVLLHQENPTETSWALSTSKLSFNNKTRFISTDQAVTITYNTHRMQAVGMEARINDKHVTLLSKVRGQYDISK